MPHEVFECVVMCGGQAIQRLTQHVQTLVHGAAAARDQTEVVGVEGNERYGQLTEVQLHGPS